MKLKLTVQYHYILSQILSQLIVPDSSFFSISRQAALHEFYSLIFPVVARYHNGDINKVVSKKIPDSYAILFFGCYNGFQLEDFQNTVKKEVCKQIELELFKSGKYNLPLRNQ
jgi:hypothetical protein